AGLDGDVVVDVAGLVDGPGFVDVHSHADSIAGHHLKALDGVTTSLELESGRLPVSAAYARAASDGRPLHYGFSASWAVARAVAHGRAEAEGRPAFDILGDPQWQRSSTPSERAAWLGLLEAELAAGALGVGVLLGYAPHSDPGELVELARLAAGAAVPLFVHAREPHEIDPSAPVDGPEELVTVSAETGVGVHQCHVNSTSLRHIDRVLALIDRARGAGSAPTVEAYPYGAGSTAVGAVFLDPDTLPAWGITPQAIVLLPSGERIADASRLREVRARDPGTLCVIEYLDESDPRDLAILDRSLEFPDAVVASDSMPIAWADGREDSRAWPLPPGGFTHPRTAGTFARALRRFVRGTGRWDWSEAFRRCSLLPARLLSFAPDAAGKGHLSVGADADIVVLDPGAVSDAASYLEPTRPSVGVRHLLVAGEWVVRGGALVAGAYPGRPLRA
ncbi:MAG: amidohydrolase family protein, partial [Acidimicrobiales bacterium]